MIYISSSCVRTNNISKSISKLVDLGYRNIELSGGTQPYPELETDLNAWRNRGVQLICHNYFPPPKTPFVLNLASMDDKVHKLSLDHAKKAIELSEKIDADKFGVHAGFRINIPLNEIGKPIRQQELFDENESLNRFVQSVKAIKAQCSEGVQLYIENNVLSRTNYRNFNNKNPFFFCDVEGYRQLKELIDFKFILDVGHLKVSCETLGKNFQQELDTLLPLTDYIHISDNDGYADTNNTLKPDSDMFNFLSKYNLTDYTITIEVYDGVNAIKESYESVLSLCDS